MLTPSLLIKARKCEFLRHIFEEIHRGEQEELKLAMCGLSEKYRLANVTAHLSSASGYLV